MEIPGGRQQSQGIFWLLTIKFCEFTPYLPPGCVWIRGQLELGEGGFLHWQVIVAMSKRCRRRTIKELFGNSVHAELSNSPKASEYVWKETTRVAGTQFELGVKPFQRNSKTDWEQVWTAAKSRNFEAIPAHTRLLCFRSILSVAAYYDQPNPIERDVYVFWGATGTGKSRRAWDEASMEAYPKDPNTKFWNGYRHQQHVVIDEFRGAIGISHLLRWFDRYPVCVELKGSSIPLVATKIWITSNISPNDWYPDVDAETLAALRRRLNITHFN